MSAQLCSMVHIQTLNSCRHEPRQKQDCARPISARVVIVLLQNGQFNSNPLNSQTDPLDQQLPLRQGCAGDPTWSRSPRCWYQRRPPGSCRRSPWLCWWRPPPRWRQSWPRFPWRRGHVLLQTPHPPPFSRLDVLPSHWVLTIKITWEFLARPFVAYEHDHHVTVAVLPRILQPCGLCGKELKPRMKNGFLTKWLKVSLRVMS